MIVSEASRTQKERAVQRLLMRSPSSFLGFVALARAHRVVNGMIVSAEDGDARASATRATALARLVVC